MTPSQTSSLFSRHSPVLQTSFSEIKRQAAEQFVLVGTPGSVSVREVKGSRFYYRQFYDPQGKKRAEYVGPVKDPAAEEDAPDALADALAAVPRAARTRLGSARSKCSVASKGAFTNVRSS